VFGLCAAWVIARNQFEVNLFISLLDVPFASPGCSWMMIVLLYGRNGWFGPLLGSKHQNYFCHACNGTGECFITLPLSPAVIPV